MVFRESQTVELKESWRDDCLKTVCAFANTDGGTLYVGVNDKGEIAGVEKAKKLMDDLPNKVMNCLGLFVSIYLRREGEREYIEMNIPKSSISVSYNGKYYVRCGSTTQELSGGQLQQLILKAKNVTWDEVIVPEASWQEIDTEAVRLFVRRAVEYNRLPLDVAENDIRELFEHLNLSRQGILTRAAVLLFFQRPTNFNIMAVCKIGRFRGRSHTDLVTDDVVEGPLFRMPDRIMELLHSKYLNRNYTYSGLQRVETLEYPEIALREAILNAVIHRDYSGNSFFYIKVFDERMELWNEGQLLEPLNIDALRRKHLSRQRNRIMADVFYRAGQIESWGRGTLKMIENAREGGYAEPAFEVFQEGVLVTFRKKNFDDGVNEGVNDGVNEGVNDGVNEGVNDGVKRSNPEKKILEILAEEEGLSVPLLAERIGKSRATTERYVSRLRKKGLIVFKGVPKTGGYYLAD